MSGQPNARVKALVRTRATDEQGVVRCERCGRDLEGCWSGWSYHHRRIKGMGGDRRPETQEAANIVLLCGSGTTACHGRVHSEVAEAREEGWLVSRQMYPAQVVVRLALHGPALLADDGSWESAGAA